MRKIVHICAGWEPGNGAANIARLIGGEQARAGHEVVFRTWAGVRELRAADQVWIHCGWKPCLWWAAFWARGARWMPEACYDPVRLAYHGWKKKLVGPIERWCLRRMMAVVATCEAEAAWIRAYEPRVKAVEVQDIRRFFNLCEVTADRHAPLRVLYLGRQHPLKGLSALEAAVAQLNAAGPRVELRVESNAFGDEKERVWTWCDVFCLPTLSDNFGLVVAEALEHGKPVITTDGAPVWKGQAGVTYLEGFREGSEEARVAMLAKAIGGEIGRRG